MPMPPISHEVQQQIVARLERGESRQEVAAAVGLHRNTVGRYFPLFLRKKDGSKGAEHPSEVQEAGIEYREVPGFPQNMVGSDGSVWMSDGLGGWRRNQPTKDTSGYRRVGLLSPTGEIVSFLVHRVVLTAFRGPCPIGMEGCHADDNPLNNDLSNLRWDTPHGNAQDRVRNRAAMMQRKGRTDG
jgi:hypothetical protein